MDDERIGAALRMIRMRRRLRQSDVAALAGVPRENLVLIERGELVGVAWGRVRAVVAALGANLTTELRWHGADLDRAINAGHAAMHEAVGRFCVDLPGWENLAEVSFSIFGERGVIDILAWHAASRCLLIIELKTVLGDPQALVGTMDRRMRLGKQIAAERGWQPLTVSAWVVFAESRTNRRHVAAHPGLLRGRFPVDGHGMRAWLAAPAGSVMALSFWTNAADGDRIRASVTPRRVRPSRAERADAEAA